MIQAGDTRNRILDEAESLLQERGYNGFSYKHVAEKLGMKNAAVHYHFPTKADLGEALVHRFRERFRQWVEHLERKYQDQPEKLLDGFIAIPRSYMKRNDLVCPLAVLEADFSILPQGMQQQTRYLGRDMRDWLTALLEQGSRAGVFILTGRPRTNPCSSAQLCREHRSWPAPNPPFCSKLLSNRSNGNLVC